MDGGLTAGVTHDISKQSAAVKQENIGPIRSKVFSILSSIIFAEQLSDYLAYAAFLFEDVQLISFFIDPKMAKVYYVPTSITRLADIRLRYDNMSVEAYAVILGILCLVTLLPGILIWTASAQSVIQVDSRKRLVATSSSFTCLG